MYDDAINAKANIQPPTILTSLSLTHVQYVGRDIYSKVFAHLTLSPLAITCGYIAVILTTRDLTVILMLAGQFINECINYILKRMLKQGRPTDYLGDGYGMPSSHSQFMGFFATYLIILMYRMGSSSDSVGSHITTGIVIIWASLVIYSRVRLLYHTWQQVLTGTFLGCAFAVGYYFFTQRFLRSKGMQDWMIDNSYARWAYLVDREQMGHVYQWEWDQFQQWRQTNTP
ncbi:PAP2 domain protein [Dissophora ornata]|nr:hypothetical protein BGZ58_002497 [Dissophora ornata]KAI8595521.1 PAP2 domain protein [Dissophora ornata]